MIIKCCITDFCIFVIHKISIIKVMKSFDRNSLLSHLWWTLIEIICLLFGKLYITSVIPICAGIIIILCGWLNNSKNKKVAIIANVLLALYTLIFAIYTCMLIAVASPESWFAILLLLIALINIFICIKNSYNIFKL